MVHRLIQCLNSTPHSGDIYVSIFILTFTPSAAYLSIPYSESDLKVGLSQYTDYQAPRNELGPYLYFGFIPESLADNHGIQGVNINGENLQFSNCDANGNSYIALFPNFDEEPFIAATTTYSFAQNLFLKSVRNPSGRLMPTDFFMFAEIHFGGCGAFSNTDNVHNSVVATTIGFR